MHEALRGGFLRYRRNWFADDTNFHQLSKDFYTLFLRNYGLSANLHDSLHKPSLASYRDLRLDLDAFEDIGNNLLLTDEALQEVIVSQAIPFNTWHPFDRFCTAVNSRGGPAETFVKHINAGSIVQLAQWADHRGKTALHWAAEHFGSWASQSDFRVPVKRSMALRNDYMKLIAMLITMGTDVHALTSENETPFTCVVGAMHSGYNGWFENELHDAVVQWVQVIQDAGVLLHAYVVAENDLQSRLCSAASKLRMYCNYDYRKPWMCRLVVSKTTTLALEVGLTMLRPLWQYTPPPGAWGTERYQPETIVWQPQCYFEGDDCIVWQHTEDVEIMSALRHLGPYQISSLEKSAYDAWREWAFDVQDDHGFIATTLQRRPTLPGPQGRMRRAASLPPPMTMRKIYSAGPGEQCCLAPKLENSWVSNPHRCPLDLAW
jgi:hypothetical protein